MKNLKAVVIALFVVLALIIIGCGGAFPGVAGGNNGGGNNGGGNNGGGNNGGGNNGGNNNG
jgi:hypothetical protein